MKEMPSITLNDKIAIFYKKNNEIFRKPLEKIIRTMMKKCEYINGESLERHNWGNNPIKLKHIPNISSPNFEEELLNALNLEDNEKSIVELLWGDIQLGKRVHACIIMWISVYILKRPVLYVFRNLIIDQKQLQDDIVGTEKYNFNIQFIKSLFEEFNRELQDYFEETNIEYWKEYKLPELKDINSNDIINKLSNKESINSNDIFSCLMNYNQLTKIDEKFNEYIYYNNELVNITVLVDESDLMSPTSSNDRSNEKDKKDTTACEILLAKIYKKVKYALHVTGTAHSLLYNVTTRLSEHTDIQIKISKVHKMKRSKDYYGLFSESIHFDTRVEPWWEYDDPETQKKTIYDIVQDYNVNIKKIIEEILKRPLINYNSLLISEEKTRANQFCLIDKIIKDFSELFLVIYHGNCLRLYLSKKYENEIKRLSHWDSKESTSKRLWQKGGVYGSSIDTEKSEKLPNNYCYFNIDTNLLNIKLVYKLLRILFKKSDINILHKTIITITGKYGERGYSFTSDDYDTYSLHLTDQYFVSHASLNCTNASQQLRIQLKSNDVELKNGTMKLTLWTTRELQDIMQNFYVKFIKEIEKFIMRCNSWEEIKDLLESIIDNGELKFGKYMKYIDSKKKGKNIKSIKHYDSKNNGYKLFVIDDMDDNEIKNLCKQTNLPDYICINDICKIAPSEVNSSDKTWFAELIEINYDSQVEDSETYRIKDDTAESYKKKLYRSISNKQISSYKELAIQNKEVDKNICVLIVDEINNKKYKAIFKPDNYKINTSNIHQDISIKKSIVCNENNKIMKSTIKKEYQHIDQDKTVINYYWKTPDGWLYLYHKDKPDIISLDILIPGSIEPHIQKDLNEVDKLPNDVMLFTLACCKKPDKINLRVGLKEIYKIYEKWCKKNNKKCLKTQKKIKEELEKINYKEEESKGVDINNKPGKRGYNILLSI